MSSKREQITVLHSELADKEDLIKDQLDTINEYREEMVRLGDNVYEASYCPVLENRRKMRRARGARGRPGRRTRTRLEAAVARERSLESDSLSEPEAGVSLARIGLPLSYPDNPDNCSCDRNNLLSDSDDKQSKFEIFFFLQIFFKKFLILMLQGQNIACLLLIILFCLLFLIFSDKRFYSLAFPPDNPETSGNSEIGMSDN